MSTQSIKDSSKQELFYNADYVIASMAEDLILYKKYRIGEFPNLRDFKDLDLMTNILCENNCRLKCEESKLKEDLNLLIIKYK